MDYSIAIVIGLIISVIWGYFTDLRKGQINWFIGRLVFVTTINVLLVFVYNILN